MSITDMHVPARITVRRGYLMAQLEHMIARHRLSGRRRLRSTRARRSES